MTAADPQPMVQIDWQRTGIWAGPYDDVTDDTAGNPGVTVEHGMDQGRPLRPPMIAAADFELINEDGKYSQESPSAPLYQQVQPALPVQITSHTGDALTYREHVTYRSHTLYGGRPRYTFHTGVLSDISERIALGDRRVAMRSLGVASKLKGRIVSTGVYTNVRTDQALGYLLDAAEWPTADRALSLGDTTLLYWWADNRDAWDAAVELLNSEGPGALYEDALGVIHFENRNYRANTTRSNTVQVRFGEQIVGEITRWYTDLTYEPSWDAIVNHATYRIRRRTVGTLQKVWEHGVDITLAAGDVANIWIKPSDPVTDAVTPVVSTDYSVTGGTISVSLSATSGASILLTLTGLTGTAVISGVTSAGIQVRAKPLTSYQDGVVGSTTNTDTSKARYGLRAAEIVGWPEVALATATAVCNAVVTRRQYQLPQLTMTCRNVDDAHLATLFGLQVSDRINVTTQRYGWDLDCWVESMRFDLRGNAGPMFVATLGLEASAALVPGALWDSGIWDTSLWSD